MKNLNADFLLDIWADLKAKRLAPVAVGLAVAVVAMPALMLNGEETPVAAGPLPIAPVAATNGAEVELAEELAERGSKLDSYKARDPFDGLVTPGGDDDAPASGTAIAPSDLVGGDAGSDSGTPLSGSGSGGGGGAPSLDLGGSPGSGGSGGLTTGGGTPVVKRPPRGFNYELDVKFGRPGREKRYRSLERMSFLPSEKVPALLFMGVPVEAKSALFFVHPTLSHAGEGICIPSKSNCNFLELKIGRDHFLSVNDYEFRIHLLGIKKVRVDDGAGARKTSRTRRSARTNAGEEHSELELPALVDGLR